MYNEVYLKFSEVSLRYKQYSKETSEQIDPSILVPNLSYLRRDIIYKYNIEGQRKSEQKKNIPKTRLICEISKYNA